MKKLFTSIAISFMLFNLFAQQDNSSLLTVSGLAKLMVTPDITVINVELNSTNLNYSLAIESLQKKSADFKSFLKSKGIDKKYVKSENFQVDKYYDYENGQRKYKGYMAKLWIRLEFQNNIDMANKIINAINTSQTDADVSISFEISLPKEDSINNVLIENAITDAKEKAELIAKSTSQQIVKIEKINYGVRENVVFDNSMQLKAFSVASAEARDAGGSNFTITPQDIERSTNIIIYWRLEQK